MWRDLQDSTLMNIKEYVEQQINWSKSTFADHPNLDSILSHIEEEIAEIRENPTDPYEWIDIIILALEGAWRIAGLTPEEVALYLRSKQEINSQRSWPDITTYPKGKPIGHL
jgi:hypothetical protein